MENVEREINEAEQAVKALEEDNVSSDRYGKDNEYLPLKDKCFEKRFQGYNYNFCFYGSAKQDSNNLGSWDGLKSMQLRALQRPYSRTVQVAGMALPDPST